MIQYNNSNPDYGVPEYEGGDADMTVENANKTLDTIDNAGED